MTQEQTVHEVLGAVMDGDGTYHVDRVEENEYGSTFAHVYMTGGRDELRTSQVDRVWFSQEHVTLLVTYDDNRIYVRVYN